MYGGVRWGGVVYTQPNSSVKPSSGDSLGVGAFHVRYLGGEFTEWRTWGLGDPVFDAHP